MHTQIRTMVRSIESIPQNNFLNGEMLKPILSDSWKTLRRIYLINLNCGFCRAANWMNWICRNGKTDGLRQPLWFDPKCSKKRIKKSSIWPGTYQQVVHKLLISRTQAASSTHSSNACIHSFVYLFIYLFISIIIIFEAIKLTKAPLCVCAWNGVSVLYYYKLLTCMRCKLNNKFWNITLWCHCCCRW